MTGAMWKLVELCLQTCKAPSGNIQRKNKRQKELYRSMGTEATKHFFLLPVLSKIIFSCRDLKLPGKTQVCQIGPGVVFLSHNWK